MRTSTIRYYTGKKDNYVYVEKAYPMSEIPIGYLITMSAVRVVHGGNARVPGEVQVDPQGIVATFDRSAVRDEIEHAIANAEGMVDNA